MASWLSEREQRLVEGAETASADTPIPTQIVSNGEYLPPPQSEIQKRVERRTMELADENGKRLGLERRKFLRTSCGMAAAFLAIKQVYGVNVFQVDEAEASEPELMLARAQSLAGQFILDDQTHFVRDRSEEHTSELQSRSDLVCRLLLEKKKNIEIMRIITLKKGYKILFIPYKALT